MKSKGSKRLQALGSYAFEEVDKKVEELKGKGIEPIDFGVGDPTAPTPELVHGQNVWFVPPDDSAALAQAIQQLLADPDLRTQLGQQATAVADLFTWDKIAAQTAKFCQQLQGEC